MILGRFVPPEATTAPLARLRARYGVVAVLGNHDWWCGGPRVRDALESAGIRVLENDADADGEARDLGGGCRPWTRVTSVALAAVPADARHLLTHNPDVFPRSRAVASPWPATPTAARWRSRSGPPHRPRYGERYAYGLVVEGGRALFVSPGLGTSLLPVRFRVPPEISIVTLSAP